METEYIEKQAAISLPVLPKEHREYQTSNLDDAFETGWYELQRCIEEIPPADVRSVVRGRWVRHYCDDDGVPDGWGCDRCKEWYFFGPSKPNFCPNCGADMRGGYADGDEKD